MTVSDEERHCLVDLGHEARRGGDLPLHPLTVEHHRRTTLLRCGFVCASWGDCVCVCVWCMCMCVCVCVCVVYVYVCVFVQYVDDLIKYLL